jgi:hypothetical protein
MNPHSLPLSARDDPSWEGFRTDLPPDLPTGDVVEVPLLLEGWQMSALERAAHTRGLTAGEMVRTLLRDFISDRAPARPADRPPPSQARAV